MRLTLGEGTVGSGLGDDVSTEETLGILDGSSQQLSPGYPYPA